MSQRVFWVSVLTFTLIFTGLFTVQSTILALALPFGLYLLASLFFAPPRLDLVFERQLSTERALVGTAVAVKVQVTNNGHPVNNLWVGDTLSEKLEIIKGSPQHLLNLKTGETRTWAYTLSGQRGYFTFGQIHAEIYDRVGLRRFQKTFPTTGQLLIIPDAAKLKRVSIRPRKTRVYSGEIPARSGGLGVEFFGVRDYQLGDSPGWINWRATAKHPGKIYTNEFEQERVSDVGIILDGRERSNYIAAGQSIFEHSVLAAATLSNAFINQGNRVSLLHYGKYLKWSFPGYGKQQKEKILRELSQAEPGKSLVFAYLQFIPIQIFPAQSQIVLISPLMPDDPATLLQLRARGYQVLVISPDPIQFELAQISPTQEAQQAARILQIERQHLLRTLIQSGIQVINWEVSQPFDQVVRSLSRAQAPRPVFGGPA